MRIIRIPSVLQNCLSFCRRGRMIPEMNTHDVKKLTGYTDRQIDYLLKTIDVLKREKAQGKTREYSYGDLALFATIAELKKEGVSIRDINELLNVINENPGKRAAIAIYPVKNKKPIVKLELNVNNEEIDTQIAAKPELLLLFEGEWLSPDNDSEGFVLQTYVKKNQLELELEEGV